MARRSPSQLSGRPLVNAITARSKDPGASAPKEEVPLSVNPAVREFVIASAVAKYASFLRARCSAKSSRFSGLFERQRTRANGLLAETGGFEPPIRCDPYNGLANRRLQPLGHVSGDGTSVSATSSTVKHPDGRPERRPSCDLARFLIEQNSAHLRIFHIDMKGRFHLDRQTAFDRRARQQGFEPALDVGKGTHVVARPLGSAP